MSAQATNAPIFATFAPKYAAQGFEVFPLVSGTKVPPKDTHGLSDATSDLDKIAEWARMYPMANIGLRTGKGSGVDVIDVDPEKGGFETEAALRKQKKFLPNRAVAMTRSGGRHLFVKHHHLIRTGTNRLGKGIDFRGEGGYVVAAPSMVEGKRYRFLAWPGKENLPHVPSWILDGIRAKARAAAAPRPPMPLLNLTEREKAARDALQYVSCDDYDIWITVGMILRVEFGEKGRALWDLWSSKSDKFDQAIQDKKWTTFNPTKTGIGGIFKLRKGQRIRYYEL